MVKFAKITSAIMKLINKKGEDFMKTATKIGLLGITVTAITSIIFGVIEIKDARNGKKRMNKEDIKLIAAEVVKQQNNAEVDPEKDQDE